MWKIISNSLIWSTLFKRNFDATTWFCFSDCKTPEVTARFSWKIVLVRFTLKKLFYGTMVERVEQLFQFQFSLSQLGFFCLLCISLIYFQTLSCKALSSRNMSIKIRQKYIYEYESLYSKYRKYFSRGEIFILYSGFKCTIFRRFGNKMLTSIVV